MFEILLDAVVTVGPFFERLFAVRAVVRGV